MYSEQLEQLIKSVIADGVITEKERAVLHKRAVAEGIDEDEIDIYVDGLVAQMKSDTPKMEVPKSVNIDFKHVNKTLGTSPGYAYYVGQKWYQVNSIPKGLVKKIYLNFFKEIIKDGDTKIGIAAAYVCKDEVYGNEPQLTLKTNTNSLELRGKSSHLVFPANMVINNHKHSTSLCYLDEEMLKILCDAKQISFSMLYTLWNEILVDIKNIIVSGLATYAQVFYRSVVDNSAYPDAVINDEALKRKKDVYDVDDVDDDMAIRLLTEDTDKWEKIKPRPGIIDQYKGLKGITITDIHFGAYFNDEDHLELKALSDKKGDFRFFFVYERGWWKLKKDLKLVVNMEDHQVRYLQNNDEKYAYEVDASVLQEMFTTKHNVSLEDRYLKSVPQGRWKEAFEYLTDSNKMKEWIEKYEENEESGFFGKLKNFFGS